MMCYRMRGGSPSSSRSDSAAELSEAFHRLFRSTDPATVGPFIKLSRPRRVAAGHRAAMTTAYADHKFQPTGRQAGRCLLQRNVRAAIAPDYVTLLEERVGPDQQGFIFRARSCGGR